MVFHSKIFLLIVTGILVIGGIGSWWLVRGRSPAQVFTVLMKDSEFEPRKIEIPVGSTVVFKNEGVTPHWPASDLHPTHGIYPEFDPQRGVDPGDAWSFRFSKTGSWRFHDHLAPLVRGVIHVQ